MRDSDTIDVGIDLGTTNSAVAVVKNGEVSMIKNNDDQSELTPSAVWIPKPDMIHVGRAARDSVEKDPENTASEFKLEMGLADARRTFVRAGLELTPQQLSAEVLKSLRADAASRIGSPPEFAVITVPAAFALNQNKATIEAAVLAGFNAACPLVQEPTAAAFAYGFQDATDRGYWMVFDFGGGTFDAAVVSKQDGDLRVLNHAGDPYLGGKLIDWALVERVLAPAASHDLGLADFRRANPSWRQNFGKLKVAAEEAKIRLSRREQISISVELSTRRGDPVTFEYTLRRDELDSTAEPYYARAINLCRSALREASLDVDDIDRLLLVGGATLAPGLRERLAEPGTGIGIELDTSVDPTTVVARGAAIFASTIRRPAAPQAMPAAGEFVADLAYEPTVTTTTPTVGGRLRSSATVEWTEYFVTLSNPQGQPPFRSARIRLNAKGAFATEVDIDLHKTSRFTVELTDGTGTRRKLTPDTLSITHREVEFGGVQLNESLGIQLADRAFAPLLRKNASLPARAREVFHTSSALKRSDPDAVVRIPVVQGERSRGDRNREVGMLEIRPRDVRIDLPAGSEVEVTFEVDANNLVTVIADIPLVEAQFEAEFNIDNVRTKTAKALQAELREAERRLADLRGMATASPPKQVQQRLDQLDDERPLTAIRDHIGGATTNAGEAAAAEEGLRGLQSELDDIEEAVKLPALVLNLRQMIDEVAALVDQAGTPSDRQELAEVRRRTEQAVESGDTAAAQAVLEQVARLRFELERRNPDWPVKLFFGLQDMIPRSGQANALIQEGKQAIASRDSRALDAVNQRLIRLLPQDEREQQPIGLRKRA